MNLTAPELATMQPSDHLGDYLNAFRIGQTLAAPSADPLDPFTNAVTGRLALAGQAQSDQAARRAELLDAIGTGLTSVPYQQRSAILGHLAPALEAEGIPSAALTGFDPTDEALPMSVDQARATKALIGDVSTLKRRSRHAEGRDNTEPYHRQEGAEEKRRGDHGGVSAEIA